jgi:hypothetical protein
MLRKLGWLVGLWAGSVLVVGAAALALRALLPH